MVTDHAEHTAELEHSAHRHERPEDWGWHAEMGRTARVAGLISIVFMAFFLLTTHGSKWELVWNVGFMAALAIALVWDHYRRRNSWRS